MAAEPSPFAGWDDITETGQMPGSSPGVSIAWRWYKKGQPGAEITLNRLMLQAMRWEQGQNVRLRVAPDRRTLALVPDPVGKKLAVRANCGAVFHRLDWVQSERRRAERVLHRIEGGALILPLPAWAHPPGGRAVPLAPPPVPVLAAPAPRQVAPAKPLLPPAPATPGTLADLAMNRGIPLEDVAEAEAMVRNGSGATQLREYFGWELPHAQAFAKAVRDRKVAEKVA